MCTILDRRISKKIHGWKIVALEGGEAYSYFYSFRWFPKEKHIVAELPVNKPKNYNLFHCFARRKDARIFKQNNNNKANLKIIKVILSGEVYTGTTDGMEAWDNNRPAVCGTEAYWDGKFHR